MIDGQLNDRFFINTTTKYIETYHAIFFNCFRTELQSFYINLKRDFIKTMQQSQSLMKIKKQYNLWDLLRLLDLHF